MKKINFKEKKYVLPLLALPFLFLFVYVGAQFSKEETPKETPKELSLSLGETQDSILTKNDAYDALFQKDDNRTMLGGLDKEHDSLLNYEDQLSLAQKRKIDSLKDAQGRQNNYQAKGNPSSYYNKSNNQNSDKDYKRSEDIIRMLNDKSYGKTENNDASVNQKSTSQNQQSDPMKFLKEQMLVMDSLEKAKDPEYQSKLATEKKLKTNKEKMDAFLNSTFNVSKSGINSAFNAFYKEKENSFIKAVIDENNKGFLGSRIRFRLLEDIFVGNKKIDKGSILYGQISGFSMQRVDLKIVSVFTKGEIFPVNLSIYDIDGMKGLYIPQSVFREMMREMGSNSVQGTQMDMGGEGFFTSLGSKLFTSTSKSIANLIKANKAKLKYNSYVFLIDEKQLKEAKNK
ncbi:conjugative transposon protein TraM [Chryseobacterium piscicola]|uniref:Conjugal transfer protein TraM n=1 Tax=Chryseobacterium piscicola TaxID=551459 RepID=A0A2S7KGB4_9FLAO|nr:conjugative transposon protein TraM [Chryseobacterium piscicola]PQA95028.1 conjugal transfer protein TraM [Chryseobacterium piscicola]